MPPTISLAATSIAVTPPPAEVYDSPGPGWVFALTGDANQDGIADHFFYFPSDAVSDTTFEDARLAAIAVKASDVVLVQRSESGLNTLLSIDRHGRRADQPLFDFMSMFHGQWPYVLTLSVGVQLQGPYKHHVSSRPSVEARVQFMLMKFDNQNSVFGAGFERQKRLGLTQCLVSYTR